MKPSQNIFILILLIIALIATNTVNAVPGDIMFQDTGNGTLADRWQGTGFVYSTNGLQTLNFTTGSPNTYNMTPGNNTVGTFLLNFQFYDDGNIISASQYWSFGFFDKTNADHTFATIGSGICNAGQTSYREYSDDCGVDIVARSTAWHNASILLNFSASKAVFWIDGINYANDSALPTGPWDSLRLLGSTGITTNWMFDNITLCDTYCPGESPPPVSLQTLNLANLVNGSTISGFCITATGTNTTQNLCNTTGSSITFNTTGTYNITFYNITGAGANTIQTYFNETKQNHVFSATNTLTLTTYQARINVTATQLYTLATINRFNASNNQTSNTTTTGSLLLPANNGTNTGIRVNVSGNYSSLISCTVNAPLTTQSCNASGIYDEMFKINATVLNGTPLINFTINILNLTIGSGNYTTTNGTAFVPALQGYHYAFTLTSTSQSTTTARLAANATSFNYTFNNILPANSVFLSFLDSSTLLPITGNISILYVNGSTSTTETTNTSSFNKTGLAAGTWTFTFTSSGYITSQYFIVVSDTSAYSATIYLTQGSQYVVFTTIDSISSQPVIGASIQQYLTINGTPTLITTSTTDVTGSSQFTYTPNVAYTFNITATGYTSRVFTLNPIIFSTYTIKLTSPVTLNFSTDYQNVQMTYYPKVFYDNQSNTMTILFNSLTSSFTNYSYNLSYPGGTKSGSGVNAAGQSFIVNFNITGATQYDNVNITLNYDTGFGNHQFNFSHNIIVGPPPGTFAANIGNTYGMGLIDRVLIGILIIIIMAGIISLAVSPIAGLLVAMFLMGLFTYMGFWEWWLVGISFLIGFIIIIRRTE